MFPITPIALHEGWIEGKERIITAVSGSYRWKHQLKPQAHRFDLMGEEITPNGFAISKVGAEWRVKVNIADWAEVVIID